MHGNLLDEKCPCRKATFAQDTQTQRDPMQRKSPYRLGRPIAAGLDASGMVLKKQL
jgi:hypothetical protein